MTNISIEDIEKVEALIATLHDWSGAAHDTPDDTEVLESNGVVITLGDLKDAFGTLARCKDILSQKK